MRKTILVGAAAGLLLTAGLFCCQASACNETCPKTQETDPNAVDAVLAQLETKANELQSFQCKIDYVFKQPLLESQARQKGTLYYAKFDDRSYLRVDFDTIQYDQDKEQKRKEQFLFDGVWATFIDYQVKSVQRQQMSEPDEPVDAFSLVTRRVPVLGFSRIDELREQFDIELVSDAASKSSDAYRLHMSVKPDSVYQHDYSTIDFQVDKSHGLPTRIEAVSAQEDLFEEERDIHQIELTDPKINKGIPRERFDVKIPDEFSVENIPLQRDGGPK